ncbi:hypothetical protein [Streptomyces sp. SYSU K217416]
MAPISKPSRAAGYAPVAETADVTVRIEQSRRSRATAPIPPPRVPDGSSRRRNRVAARPRLQQRPT